MALNHPILAYGSMLVTAPASLYYVIQGVRTGEVGFGFQTAKKAEDPIFFWFALLCYVAFAIALGVVVVGLLSGYLD